MGKTFPAGWGWGSQYLKSRYHYTSDKAIFRHHLLLPNMSTGTLLEHTLTGNASNLIASLDQFNAVSASK
ncbi:hypothetical protein IAQ61_010875 [Plenodomus lingam]|uniref:uncharacterized protein n=1 Tax=Leptosphaeria maculans TaxID=5022 RepID=UPI00332CC74B|nr:hypothetical protein IAQ61_010875 [Plenodomus lingam]